MKKVKGFSDFTYESVLENVNINKYQRSIHKFYKASGVKFHNTEAYSTSLTVLVRVVQLLLEHGTFTVDPTINNAVAITIFAVSVLTNESRDKVDNLYNYITKINISDEDINKVINQLRNIQAIFKFILKESGKEVKTFIDMLGETGLLVPFLSIISNQLTNNILNPDLLTGTIKEYQDALGELKFKLFLNRILRKLDIITTGTNKFQNKDNVKPLKVNDEFKSPAFKTEDVVLEESLRDEMTPKAEEEIDKIIPIKNKELIDQCFNFIKNETTLNIVKEPNFYVTGNKRYSFAFGYWAHTYLLHFTANNENILLLNLSDDKIDERPINSLEEFKEIVTDSIIIESIRNKMVGKSKDELTKAIPWEDMNFINKCHQYINNTDLSIYNSEPDFFDDYGTQGYGFEFYENKILAFFIEWNTVEIKDLETGDQVPIENFTHFKSILDRIERTGELYEKLS